MFKKAMLFAAVALSLSWPSKLHADPSGWTRVAFSGQTVSLVAVNPLDVRKMSAFVDNQVQYSTDRGATWAQGNLPIHARVLRYDPYHAGVEYAGTDRGVYKSQDNGEHWSFYGNNQTSVLQVMALDVSPNAVFANQYDGVGTSHAMFRYKNSGAIDVLPFPEPRQIALNYDQQYGRLYGSSQNTMYKSDDNGDSWQAVASTGQIGARTQAIVAHGSEIWQLSLEGLFHSSDEGASWRPWADRNNVEYLRYDMYPQGTLVAGHNAAYFPLSANGNSFHRIYGVNNLTNVSQYDIGTDTLALAQGEETLWAGTNDGLWSNIGLIPGGQLDQVQHPVIVIPGILGSWQVAGKWEMDPIFHSYQPLMDYLKANGYVENQTLFGFPYQWRADNAVTAKLLEEKIAEVKGICHCDKVDIVGHSMGGLVARQYIESDTYRNDVDKLILLGTPNAGSVEDYSVWEGGVSSVTDILQRYEFKLFNLEAFANGYPTITDYVRHNVKSVGQLLPVYSYIDGRNYHDNYPVNSFLENLNVLSNINSLKQRTHVSIVGNNTHSTLTGLKLSNPSLGLEWPDGELLNKYYGDGDNTVPYESLNSIGVEPRIVESNHGGLPTHGKYDILRILRGLGFTSDIANQPITIQSTTLITASASVSIDITDLNGNPLENTKFKGFLDESQKTDPFITVSDLPAGIYKIIITNPTEGRVHTKISIIGGDEANNDVKNTTISILPGDSQSVDYDSDKNKVSNGDAGNNTDKTIVQIPLGESSTVDESNQLVNGVVVSDSIVTTKPIDHILLASLSQDLTSISANIDDTSPAKPSIGTTIISSKVASLSTEAELIWLIAAITVMLTLWLAAQSQKEE